MKKIITLLSLFVSLFSFSQIYNPVKWSTSVSKISDTEYYLVTTANIENGWSIYSQNVPEGGPRPTVFNFSKNEKYKLVGKTIEEKGVTKFDKTFEMTIKKFSNKTTFKQKIQVLGGISKINGEVEFMVCNDHQCLPPKTVTLSFNLPTLKKPETTVNKVKSETTRPKQEQQQADNTNTENSENSNDKEKTINNDTANNLLYGISKNHFKQPTLTQDNNSKVDENNDKSSNTKSLISIFFIAFLSGFAALLTPCVFPMIPMTVSYFTKQSKNKASGIKNAIIYGLSIIAIYVFLGYVITAIFGADSLNALSTNMWFNIVFFLILVLFSLSFFGYYEITLPSSWSTKIDNNADRSGFVGIFFMALALAVVSFSCTGPIVGTLLVEAASKGGIAPIIGMLGFSFAIALPFTLFAAFPGWLNSLPKSGGWMNSVKVVLGFLELALAFKFLSNADLVAHWNVLRYEPFIIIWILIFGAMALYLFGKIKFPHDSPLKKLSFPRISFGILVAAFTIFLISGFRTNPKTGLYKPIGGIMSGLLPPVSYNYFLEAEKEPLTIFKDLKEGLAYAKKENKMIMLDFTGYACVNCRKMEENVWPSKEIDNVLRNDLVIISLYVDDKKMLPKEQQIVVDDIDGSTRKLKNYGHKWSHFQATFFNTNSQPHYVLLNSNGKQILNKPVGYTPDITSYLNWLNDGKSKSKSSANNLFKPSFQIQ